MSSEIKDILTLAEAAALFNLTEENFTREIGSAIPSRQLGGQVYLSRAALLDWLEQGTLRRGFQEKNKPDPEIQVPPTNLETVDDFLDRTKQTFQGIFSSLRSPKGSGEKTATAPPPGKKSDPSDLALDRARALEEFIAKEMEKKETKQPGSPGTGPTGQAPKQPPPRKTIGQPDSTYPTTPAPVAAASNPLEGLERFLARDGARSGLLSGDFSFPGLRDFLTAEKWDLLPSSPLKRRCAGRLLVVCKDPAALETCFSDCENYLTLLSPKTDLVVWVADLPRQIWEEALGARKTRLEELQAGGVRKFHFLVSLT